MSVHLRAVALSFAVAGAILPATAHAGAPPTCTQPPTLQARPDVRTPVPSTCVDPDGTPPPFSAMQRRIVDPPDHGTLTIGFFPDDVAYTPDDGYTGPDSFVTVTRDADGHGPPVLQAVEVTAAANQAPACLQQDRLRVRRSAVGRAFMGCTDPDGDALTFTVVAEPARGRLHSNVLRFGPVDDRYYDLSPSSVGDDAFVVAVSDGRTETRVQVDVTVFGDEPGDGPVCDDIVLDAQFLTGLSPDCDDREGDDVGLELVTGPAHGTATPTQGGDGFLYDPDDGFTGTDTFTFRGFDEHADGPVRTATIRVPGTPPECAALPSTPVRTGVARDLVIACAAAAAITDAPDHGSLAPTGTGAFRYTPDDGYSGPDAFTLTASLAGLAGPPRTYALDVSPTANIAPVCGSTGGRSVRGATVDVTVGCTDPDGDDIDYDLAEPPAHGALGAIQISPLRVAYTPDAGFAGVDHFVVRADDGHGGVTVQRHEIAASAAGSNNRPSCLAGGTSTAKDTPTLIQGFCGDPDGDPVTIAVVQEPAHGTMDGLVYTPDAGFTGTDQVVLRPSDPGGAGPRAAIGIAVGDDSGLPDPVCTDVGTTVEPGASRRIGLECVAFLTEPTALEIFTVPSHGSLGPIEGGRVTYTAPANFTGSDAFTYRALFPAFGPGPGKPTAPAAVMVDVRRLDDPPAPSPPASQPPAPQPQAPAPQSPGPVVSGTPTLPRGFALVRGLDLGTAALAMPARRVRVPGSGTVPLAALLCPGACSMRWSAELRVAAPRRGARSTATRRIRFRGTLVQLPRGGQHRVGIRLSRADRRLVRRAGTATVRLSVRVRDAEGVHRAARSVRVRG